MTSHSQRRLPIGAELTAEGVSFRVWAPKRSQVDVEIGDQMIALTHEDGGYFSGVVAGARAGTRYRFRLDGKDAFPDPASRYQPEGPHAASEVVDPSRFGWTDSDWKGSAAGRHVLYEMHIGTFTPEGTFAAAMEKLPYIADLGVTLIEVMPLGDFPGRFGWGYDGVCWFAPYHGYGRPDDFRAFVDRAHHEGLGVILDVVYNHLGPDGNYLRQYSDSYFTHEHVTDWGDAINYYGDGSRPVRELVLSNVTHWMAEYHLDGLRLDATDNVYDQSDPHLLEEIGLAARRAAGERQVVVVCENEQQQARLLRSRDHGGFGLDIAWSDDFHHSAIVALTGRREAYFTDYRGRAQELVSAIKYGYLYQGQHYAWQKQRRGHPAVDIRRWQFAHFIENHDQVANSGDGKRLHQKTSAGRHRAMTALVLLGPQSPLLFQGQEFGSSAPFHFFADHHPELARLVRKGRGEFLSQFPSLADPDVQATLPDPADPATFRSCKLDWAEYERNRAQRALHRDLITLGRCDPVLSCADVRVDGAVLSDQAFVLRFSLDGESDRLLVVNLGTELALDIAPEPLLAPPSRERGWQTLWHSEDPCYGGRGVSRTESEKGSWRIPAESAVLLSGDE